MKTVEEYIDALGGSVDKIESEDSGDGLYGHYPFTLVAQGPDGKMTMASLAFGGDVLKCYQTFKKFVNEGYNPVFMTVDFPAGADIENDFLAVFSYAEDKLEVRAIPYDNQTGVKEALIEKAATLDLIKSQIEMVLND